MALFELLTATQRLLTAGAWLEAEAAARAALADNADDPDALLLLGLAVAAMGESGRAAPILLQAGWARPEAEHPCVTLAHMRPALPRALVARQFKACLDRASGDHRLRLGFADFLLDIDRAAEAERVLALGPDSAPCHHLMGLARAEREGFDLAIESFRRAVALDPRAAASWSNLGMMLKVERQFDAAIAAHDRAVVLAPQEPRYRVNRAVALLTAGLWERAWMDYEARLDVADAKMFDRVRLMPSLGAGDGLSGLTVLALHEDGFGDTLQFLRYLPLLAERKASVVACVPLPLVPILQAVPGVTAVVSDARHLPEYDFVAPMFSLPRVFGTTVDSVPPVPDVLLDPGLVRRWAGRLPIAGLRVGLVWAGQARPFLPGFSTLDRRRSAGLAAFEPLFGIEGVSLVSLQAGSPARQKRPAGLRMADPMPEVQDFADTAAIIAGLDVVVSVDTSVVHLAGLMGKPVLLLDRYDGCWRWLSGRQDSPWYPHLTIFRQDRPGDWSGAMERVAASIEAMAMFRGPGFRPAGLREDALTAGGLL